MLGAIAGDIFCASYEFDPKPHHDVDLFERRRFFTDDTVLTIATAGAVAEAFWGGIPDDIQLEVDRCLGAGNRLELCNGWY